MEHPPVPPAQTQRLLARHALVIAPHYDDEVLGCGGAVAQLTAAGAHVAVMFLSDSAGAPGDPAGGVDYSRRRREESAAACARLGIARRIDLGLPDGSLTQPPHIAAAADAIDAYVRAGVPPLDLLLVPSPLEITPDHRAACAAVHEAIQRLRGAHDDAIRRIEVLLYEVNHSSHPDVLVDVSAQVGLLEEAMACYASQQERHDYLAAALGHRRFRTLTLPLAAGVTHAEGYRRLAGWDVATRSLSQLVAFVGGGDATGAAAAAASASALSPSLSASADGGGPLVSVIVRTRDRPRLVREALASLARGLYRQVEVVLVNDGGVSPDLADADARLFPFPLIRIEHAQPKGRAAAAQAGVDAARGDLIAFLDDDDLVAPEHLSTLVAVAQATGARVVYSDAAVAVYQLEADRGWRCVAREMPYGRDFDADRLLADNYIPLNTLLIERALLHAAGPFDTAFDIFEDWDLLIRLAALAPFQHVARVTCEYRQFRGGHGQALGENGWRRPDFVEAKARVLAKHAARLDAHALARIIVGLRAEIADSEQRRHHLARETQAESADLRGTLDRVNTELRRVYGEEARLTAAIGDLTAKLAAAEAEAAAQAAAARAAAVQAAAAEAAVAVAEPIEEAAAASLDVPTPAPVPALAAPPLRKASVLLVSWNGRAHLETCLDALKGLDTPGLPWDCWVLDNGSHDGTVDWLRAHHPDVRLIASPVNLGFCAAYNKLAAAADGDLLIFLNNDTRPAADWLGHLIEAIAMAPPDVAGAAGLILDWESARLDFGRGAMTFDGHAFQVDTGRALSSVTLPADGEEQLFACGANMIVRRDAFVAAGGFDEQYFAYYEDVDLGWRLWSGGGRVISAPRAAVRHRSAATSDTLGQFNRGFLFERNAFLTAYKNYDAALWEKMMPSVFLTFVSRLITFLTSNNPGGDQLSQDPFSSDVAPAPTPAPTWLSRVLSRAPRDTHPRVSDPLTVAQTRAMSWLLRHSDAAAERRHCVQARRRRPDAEIFDRFPLHIVPTYAGDDALFRSAGFQAWLPEHPRLIFRTLDEIMSRR